MASLTAATASVVSRPAGLSLRRPLDVASSSPVRGLPAIAMKGRVRCSTDSQNPSPPSSASTAAASLLSAAAAAISAGPAMALVDERMSTEGTGLPFGLSNNLLGWILFGVFGLIWALYFVYTSGLDEDEESGLSL